MQKNYPIKFYSEDDKNKIKFNNTDDIINDINNFISKFEEKVFNRLINPKFCNAAKFKNYIKLLNAIKNRFDIFVVQNLNDIDIKDNKVINEFETLIDDIINYLKYTLIITNNFQDDFDYVNHLKQFLNENQILNKYYRNTIKTQQVWCPEFLFQINQEQYNQKHKSLSKDKKQKIKALKIIKTPFE